MKINALGLVPELRAFLEGIPGREDDVSVILVGSVARQTQSENSDIDLLLVSRRPLTDLNIPPQVHLMRSTLGDFLKQLDAGEDFEAWCVRFGIPIRDNGLWSEILARPEATVWPSWKKKVMHGARRLFLAGKLITVGDLEAAAEELLFATGHIARGLLLKANIFPLSRPELENQISAIGYPHLASVHKALRTNLKNDLRFLKRCQMYSKKLLLHLSADDYGTYAREFQQKKRIKSRARRENDSPIQGQAIRQKSGDRRAVTTEER
jgi:hypothetical protein